MTGRARAYNEQTRPIQTRPTVYVHVAHGPGACPLVLTAQTEIPATTPAVMVEQQHRADAVRIKNALRDALPPQTFLHLVDLMTRTAEVTA